MSKRTPEEQAKATTRFANTILQITSAHAGDDLLMACCGLSSALATLAVDNEIPRERFLELMALAFDEQSGA